MTDSENDNEKWISLLKGVNFFETFTTEELKCILKLGTVKRYGMNQYIFKEGEDAQTFYVIIKGCVSIIKKSPFDSGNKVLSVLEEGDCFGEIAFLLNTKRQANVLPTVDAFIFKIEADQIDGMEESFKGKFYKQLSISLAMKLKNFNLTALESLY